MRGGSTTTITALLLMVPVSGIAQDNADAESVDKWGFSVGAFITDQDMKTEFSVNFGEANVRVDFEEDLGLEDSQAVGRLAAFYEFNPRHRIEFDIFDLSQSATAFIEEEIRWRDTTFPINSEIHTSLDLSIYKIAYSYFPVQAERGKFGLTGGFYTADIALSLRMLPNDTEEVGAVTAPLPVLGFRGEYFLSDRWRLSGSVEWFGLEIDEYNGHLHDTLLGVDFRVTDHIALGLGYNRVDIDIDATDKALRSDLIWDYSGVIAYLRATF